MTRVSAIVWAWAASIVLVWIAVAVDLGQPLWMRQHSIALTAYGAFEGRTLTLADSWKLLASQWLHVKFAHMLFNVAVISLVGAALTRRLAWWLVMTLGLLGGACGQLLAALAQPDSYISGASQAYLALCGTGLLVLDRKSVGWCSAVVGVAVSIGLDVFVSAHAGVKPGHFVPFVIGLIAGGIFLLLERRRPGWAVLRRT
ncbi:rhomboid family intramembrane serine protease [Brevundimonas sp. SORGH_AS_0993]|uniref:rhomboid family intramembrane serine protease n=1 Tax=Brevundimonas sp. SORGH_AS_0993 TaxID=3041794 RepID=UPI0027841824|nr:rhomboid family intramembrane serine protease [Brevundimonas sp. SORGH_AS_0993]MDQ1153841.1 membrane associated rhomboid family serine protease [Brevundimonas sp. SORGH_AS_0993]